jgi:hypothetical protein
MFIIFCRARAHCTLFRTDPALQTDLKTAETQHAGLAVNLEQGRAKMRELVKLQIDNRFGQFDAIFVRLMESQVCAASALLCISRL